MAVWQVLAGKLDGTEEEKIWLDACNSSFTAMIKDKQTREAEEAKATVASLPLAPPCYLKPSLARAHKCEHIGQESLSDGDICLL